MGIMVRNKYRWRKCILVDLDAGLPSNKMAKPSLAHTTNIDTLLAGADDRQELSVPPETTQDRVFFIFNNLSQMNMQQKVQAIISTRAGS